MMENQNTFDMTENIPDEMFEIIGLEKDEEVPPKRTDNPNETGTWLPYL